MLSPHHITKLHGTISDSTPFQVCLVGIGDTAIPMLLSPSVFDESSIYKFLNPDAFNNVNKAADFAAILSSNTTMEFRDIITLPPYIGDTLMNSDQSDCCVLGILTIAATAVAIDIYKEDPAVNNIVGIGYWITCFF